MKTILLLLTCVSLHAEVGRLAPIITPDEQARWNVVAMIETEARDYVDGADGEISRFQILKSEWRAATSLPYTAASNPVTAQNVAVAIQNKRVLAFRNSYRRQPSDAEWFILWHKPAHVLRMTTSDRDYATRCVNLLRLTPRH